MTSRKWPAVGLVALLLLVVAGVVWVNRPAPTPTVTSRDVLIDVVDGPDGATQPIQLDATFYLPEATPAPAVIVSPGFGQTKADLVDDATDLARRGFAVLAYSARGFGRSTGQIALNSPDYEVEDADQLVSWLSRQPEVQQDKADDPRVGITGGSYGGALALMAAGLDKSKKIDAVASLITYNDLSAALLPNAASTVPIGAATPAAGVAGADGVFKKVWAGNLFGSALSGPRLGPANACGRFTPEVCDAYTRVATTGRADQATVDLLRRNSPVSVAGDISAPTLLVQGEQDTLFGLDQADATARQLAKNNVPVKVSWYPGGHDGGPPGDAVRSEVADWFTYYLMGGESPNPGTGFSYDVQGTVRARGAPTLRTVAAPGYPGLHDNATTRQKVALSGPQQQVVTPAGGSPASISSLPGVGTALLGGSSTASSLAGSLAVDLPGQSAVFTSEPLASSLTIAGTTFTTLRIGGAGGAGGDTVLFAKLYDVGPDGRRTLPGAAVAPLRVQLPADGSAVDVNVSLAGVVRPVAAGHRLQLVVTTTDQAYANAIAPSVRTVALAGPMGLEVPVVNGVTASSAGIPAGPVIGIAIILGLAALAAIVAALRRRGGDDADPELADVPLVITGLTKSYPGRLTAVKELSFRVEHGQVLGLLGPNGAGKTTTLRMLMGLVRPTAGEIRVFGHKVRAGAPALSRIGSFVEGAGFLPHLSGAANLELYWAATGRPPEEAHLEQALEIAGLGDAVRRRVRTYSQGMRQRLAIAQAMLGLPDLLVLDEPTNGLDPPQIHQMRDVLRRYAATGRTVVVSSHLLSEVEQSCSHVVVMHKGRLVAAGTVHEIVAGGGEATFRVDRVTDAARVLRELNGATGVTSDGQLVHADLGATDRAAAVTALVKAGIAVEQAGPRRRLEDVFLRLVETGDSSGGS
ncbi:alpha/beta fold hydrolase [Kutzneria sp. NPDC052558]|uniref:alpha/beta fold hydrolase n=1 Tax=Kutzneria sp. NPDC052558 TaxID=3364121 RepID=UPI0037C590F3